MSVTSKGRSWEILHSLWIGWTFTFGLLGWIAFLYIGFRAAQRKWVLWGVLYAVPLILVIFFLAISAPASLGAPALLLMFITGIGSIVHAFFIRKEYLRHLENSWKRKVERDEAWKRQFGVEHGVDSEERTSSQSIVPAETATSSTSTPQTKQPDMPLQRTAPGSSVPTPPKPSPARTERTPKQMPVAPVKVDEGLPKISSGDQLEYQISSSYPFPLAFGFRSLTSIVDARDLYREQLRVAENLLTFLASVSLPLLRNQDRDKAEIDPAQYWLSGISPGDWKDIIGRCSKVFAAYEDNPLALAISRLSIRSEKKGFGKDVATLIRAKNDYKHDRGPVILEDIADAARETQERLKRCMEPLAFFIDHPIRQVEDLKVNRSGDEYLLKCLRYTGDHPSFPQEDVVFHRGLPEGDLYLELGNQSWVSLYPFIVTMNCAHCKAKETYFIDMWDQRRGTARMKSFERGHTMSNPEVSDALATWRG